MCLHLLLARLTASEDLSLSMGKTLICFFLGGVGGSEMSNLDRWMKAKPHPGTFDWVIQGLLKLPCRHRGNPGVHSVEGEEGKRSDRLMKWGRGRSKYILPHLGVSKGWGQDGTHKILQEQTHLKNTHKIELSSKKFRSFVSCLNWKFVHHW